MHALALAARVVPLHLRIDSADCFFTGTKARVGGKGGGDKEKRSTFPCCLGGQMRDKARETQASPS
jgi:hypothetical protein